MANDEKLLDHLKWMTGQLRQAKRRLQDQDDRAHEPVAVIGTGCRLPGGADTPEALWELTATARDAVGPLPEDRGWDLATLLDPDPDKPGTVHARAGGFLDGADRFSVGTHMRGDVAAPLIYTATALDWLSIDRDKYDIVAALGNSMGWKVFFYLL